MTASRRLLARALDDVARVAKRIVPRGSGLGDELRRLRHRVTRPGPNRPIEAVVEAFGRAHPRARFVQVGAHDGVSFDPISTQVRSRRWTGVMVEPVPYLFARLQVHFGGSRRVRLENAAVSAAPGPLPFFHLAEDPDPAPDLPGWYDALGSFRRDVVLSHRDAIPDIAERLREIEVPCVTFDELCLRHGLDDVDLVHIDTEGYDWEVVQLIDLDRWHPTALLYEHVHLAPADRDACAAHLEAHGYALLSDTMDTLAIRAAALATPGPLATAWAEARAAG